MNNLNYVPDYKIDRPEDKRHVIKNCGHCGLEIMEFDYCYYSEYVDENFCRETCMNKYLGIEEVYYER